MPLRKCGEWKCCGGSIIMKEIIKIGIIQSLAKNIRTYWLVRTRQINNGLTYQRGTHIMVTMRVTKATRNTPRYNPWLGSSSTSFSDITGSTQNVHRPLVLNATAKITIHVMECKAFMNLPLAKSVEYWQRLSS